MPRHFPDRGPYTVDQVAKIIEACPNSVRAWCDSGELSHYRTPGANGRVGHRRITAAALDSFIASRYAPKRAA